MTSANPEGKKDFFPIFIFIFAALLRVAVVLFIQPQGVTTDSNVYLIEARSIAEGRGFWIHHPDRWTTLWATEPGYPFFLGFWFLLGVPAKLGIPLVQAALGAVLAPCLYFYVRRRASRLAAVLASSFYAMDPLAIGPCPFILRELFVMAVVVATLSALDLAGRRGTTLKGLTLGLAPLSFPILGLWAVWLWVQDRCRRVLSVPRVTVVAVLLAVSVCGLWTARNMLVSEGQMAFRRHLTGILLYYTARYDFPWLPDPKDPVFEKITLEVAEKFGAVSVEDQRNVEWMVLKDVWRFFKDDPLTVTFRFFKANFWFWVEIPGAMELFRHKPVWHAALLALHLLQLALFGIGILIAVRRGRAWQFRYVWGTVLYVAVLIFPFMPIPRYYTPFLPLLDIMAGYGLAALIERKTSP